MPTKPIQPADSQGSSQLLSHAAVDRAGDEVTSEPAALASTPSQPAVPSRPLPVPPLSLEALGTPSHALSAGDPGDGSLHYTSPPRGGLCHLTETDICINDS